MHFYDKFEALCTDKGVTVPQAYKSMEINKGTVSVWKKKCVNGEEVTPSASISKKMSDYFGVSANYLLHTDLFTCTLCGLSYDPSYQPDVKEHNEFHKTFCKAVEYFGDACRPKEEWAKMKSLAYDILYSDERSQFEKSDALLELIKAYFSRSLSAWGYSTNHPKFREYVAMLLNQEKFKQYDVGAYNTLLKEYGKKPGIPEGETTYKIRDIMNFDKKQKPAPVSGDELSDVEKQILENYRSLNAKGQQKLLEYSDDLATCGNYFKNTSCSQNA